MSSLSPLIDALLERMDGSVRKLESLTLLERTKLYASAVRSTAAEVQSAYLEQGREAANLYGLTSEDVERLYALAAWAEHDYAVEVWLVADPENRAAARLEGTAKDSDEAYAVRGTRPTPPKNALPNRPLDCPELGYQWEQNVERFIRARRARVVERSAV